ncbi:MAG: c-type cytochrome [Armatimonadetes bacterium]|nr:c-type cytochrome [Armatimonadota bacterium]
MRNLLIILAAALTITARAQTVELKQTQPEVFSTTNCIGCHGQSAMGGLGPPIAQTKLTREEFLTIVRQGKGMMPGSPVADLSDEKLDQIYTQVGDMPYVESQIPVAFKVASMLTTKSVMRIFLAVFAFAAVAALWGIRYWLRCAGLKELMPHIVKFGVLKSLWIVMKSFVVDGLLVKSLWQTNKFRWFMHGLMLYGMLGLLLADILLSISNPSRGDLDLTNPLKILPIVSGIALFTGVIYVMYRYKRDPYIDNGLTLGKDFLFVNLLLHTMISGFLTVTFNRMGLTGWIMTIYIYHLASITLLIGTAPFTRFQHAWVVPLMISLTRLTEAVTAGKVSLGFEREPSPGRHHKSERIVASVFAELGPEYSDDFNMRYYP